MEKTIKMRNYFLILFAVLILSCNKKNQHIEKRRPNILFILTDDQQYDAIHALGNKDIITPNMDSLVHAGISFTNAYIMGSSSPAVCMPSRAMLLTGRNLFHLNQDKGGNPYHDGANIPTDHKTFPEVLREAGYTTFATGKWHQDHASFNRSFTTGKNIFFDGMGDHYRLPLQDYMPDGNYLSYDSLKKVKAENLKQPKGKHATEIFTDGVIDFLEKHDTSNPFMVYLAFTAPHDPREMPEKFRAMYDEETLSLPTNFMPQHPFDNGELTIRDEKLAPFPRTDSAVRTHLAEYYAMISHIDYQLKRLFDLIKAKGQENNTIIILAGDNGLAVGQHGLMGKQSLYEHAIKVPLVITGPKIPKGEKKEQLVYLIDIFPTICELLKIPVPGSVDAKSLMPIISENKPIHEDLYFAYTHLHRGLRKDNYKLIEYAVEGERHSQLFDLNTDPWELNNLAQKEEYQKKLTLYRSLLKEKAIIYGDTLVQGKTFYKNWR
jgi:arylsulfatase A-like enzyme